MRIILKLAIFLALCSQTLMAQCSDAGVCSIGSRHALPRHQVSARYVFGTSGKTDDLTIHAIQVEGTIQLLRDSRVTILLPWSRTTGPLGYASGIGDLAILWNQTVWGEAGNQLGVQIGGKFATGTTNAGNLPQAYQPGLGTNDLLIGMTYESDPWLFALGYQLSRGRSDNAVTRLTRGDDILARLGYATHIEDFIFGLEVLALKRLQESRVLDPAVPGGNSFIAVSGSDQFQVNLLSTVSLPLSGTFTLQARAAVPLRSRSVNVDGLKRSLSLSVGAQYSF